MGQATSNAATLDFDFPDPYTAGTQRDWEIKVAQIPCNARYA